MHGVFSKLSLIGCLPKGRHSEGPHEIHPISSQNCSRGGVGVGWGRVGWGGVGHARVGWGRVGHARVGWGGWVMKGWGGWVMKGWGGS